MKALLQRVSKACVRVDGEVVGEIGAGLLVFLGAVKGDGPAEVEKLARRVAGYRVFDDEDGKTNLDLGQVGGEVLVVSQFTLAADTKKGRRPSFDPALPPSEARALVDGFVEHLQRDGFRVATGVFGALMAVELVNEGPATYLLEVLPSIRTP